VRSSGLSPSRESRGGQRPLGLPSRLEIDARIDERVGEVANDLQAQPEQGKNVERGEYDRVVAAQRRFKAEQAEAVGREDDLDQPSGRFQPAAIC